MLVQSRRSLPARLVNAVGATVAAAVLWLPQPSAFAAGSDLAASGAWRCGPEGRVYTDAPCPGGREVALPAPRPPADVQAAHRVAARERALADRLRREREAREAASIAARSQPINIGPRTRPLSAARPSAAGRSQPAPTAQRPKLQRPRPAPSPDAGDGTWRAVAPASPRAAG